MNRFTLLILSIVTTGPPMLAEDVDPELLNRFMQAVAENTSIVDKISVKARLVTTVERRADTELARQEVTAAKFAPNEPEIEEISNIAVSGSYGLKSTMGRGGESSIEFVTAKNDKYAFRIRRSSHATNYGIEYLQELGVDPDMDARIQSSYVEGRSFFVAPWTVFTIPMSQLIKSPFFHVKQISAVAQDGIELVRIDFDHLTDDSDRKHERLSDAYLVCDPAHGWALREYGATFFTGGVYQQKIEFGVRINGLPIPSKFTTVYALPKSTPVVRHTVITADEVSENVAHEAFYLSHYGLPEPNFERSLFGRWAWYLALGIACLIAAWILMKRRTATLRIHNQDSQRA
ncbi:MAG: hypothetical protein R3C17_17780 [Planctomycetaceae bacterium]